MHTENNQRPYRNIFEEDLIWPGRKSRDDARSVPAWRINKVSYLNPVRLSTFQSVLFAVVLEAPLVLERRYAHLYPVPFVKG